jgi:hypothetical protein
LYHILAERAREISGKKKLETQSFAVELRIDGTLEKGEVRVQHSWDESSSNKTGVFARPKTGQQPSQAKAANPVTPVPNVPVVPAPPPLQPTVQHPQMPGQTAQNNPAMPTIPQMNPPVYVPPTADEDSEEMTQIKKRAVELYRLEVWRGGIRQHVVPVYQAEITIGRGSKSKPVDIQLAGDAEISRRHVTLTRDAHGNYWLLNEGRNPSVVNNREIPMGQRVSIAPGEAFAICSYLLRIQPR